MVVDGPPENGYIVSSYTDFNDSADVCRRGWNDLLRSAQDSGADQYASERHYGFP